VHQDVDIAEPTPEGGAEFTHVTGQVRQVDGDPALAQAFRQASTDLAAVQSGSAVGAEASQCGTERRLRQRRARTRRRVRSIWSEDVSKARVSGDLVGIRTE
jgi:hypothetical protein